MIDKPNKNLIPAPTSSFRPELASPYLTAEMLERLAGYGHEEKCLVGTSLGTADSVKWTCLLS